MSISFPPVDGVMQSLQHHPDENQYRFEHANCALDRFGCVSKVESHLAQQGVKPVMMFATERTREPSDVVAPTCMVCFDPVRAATDHTSANFSPWHRHDRLTIVR